MRSEIDLTAAARQLSLAVPSDGLMISELDILRAAHLMLHEYGEDAEDEAARYVDRLRGKGDWKALLTWTRIRQSIAVMHQMPPSLPN
jgi:hypothetical protein